MKILEILGETPPQRAIDCFFHIYDLYIFNMMQGSDYFSEADRRYLNIRLFNFYEEWAQRLWSYLPDEAGEHPYPALAYDAERLARETALSIKEIAARTGYPNTTYFCRVFKQKTGLTPSQYRALSQPQGQAEGLAG